MPTEFSLHRWWIHLAVVLFMSLDLETAIEQTIFQLNGERVIHDTHDDLGRVIVADSETTRSLYLDSHHRQSSMYKPYPNLLMLKYTHAALLNLALCPQPRHALVFGVGGGSLLKFLRWRFPEIRVHAVESRASVIQLAHTHFAVPKNDAKLQIVCSDALEFARKAAAIHKLRYDSIFVDLFGPNGPAAVLETEDFFPLLRTLLTPQGVVCLNAWSQSRGYLRHRRRLEREFAGPVRELRLGEGPNINVLLFAGREPERPQVAQTAWQRAKRLQTLTGLRLVDYYQQLLDQNRPLWQRVLLPRRWSDRHIKELETL